MKTCSKCGEQKPVSEFYTRKNKYSDATLPWCKACHRNLTGKSVRRMPVVASEIRVIDTLKSMGIFATSGKSSEFKRVDVVAWGCIPIEVKTATLNARGQYSFPFSINQVKQGSLSDFIVLVIISPKEEISYHIFPSWHPVFYTNGILKLRINYVPNGNTELSDTLLAQYKDAWYQIDNKRIEISNRIRTGKLISDEPSATYLGNGVLKLW